MIDQKTNTTGKGADIGLPTTAAGLLQDALPIGKGDSSRPLASFSAEHNPYLFPDSLLFDGFRSNDGMNGFDCGSAYFDSDHASVDNSSSAYDEPAWWLLHTKPRQEKKLAEQLCRLEIPHYLPVTKHKAVTRGRSRTSQFPLFSGYFFLWGTPEQRIRALETNRIVATHKVGDGVGLRRRLLELAELIQQGVPLTVEARLAAGRRVRVKAGSFKNMEGTVIKRAGKTKLFIFVNELLGGVSLTIEEHYLEPIY